MHWLDALGRLLDDPALQTRVAAGGAGLAADRSWPRIASQHQKVYAAARRVAPEHVRR